MEDVDKALDYVSPRLNALGVNYYIVGAVGAYLRLGINSKRVHDDLDILIEEKYVDLLKDVFENSDYIFYDNRHSSEKILNEKGYTDGEHEVIARMKGGNFHIGFFLLSKTNEQYTITEYFKDGDVQKKLERTLPLKYFGYQYDDRPIRYRGLQFKTVTPECIYKNKLSMDREKDRHDCEILSDFLDFDRLAHLQGVGKDRITSIKKA